ncbi:MAG: glucosamine-6-phosphate deaminase [Spirochaetaceae bacterium]|jgi:glucosamine-6-phosphate deaminase|nr:glucosamine-6-phosphate deaminase [Spirochaetaceae bacterium]
MRLIIHPDYERASIWAADYIAGRITGTIRAPGGADAGAGKPFTLGLPTGSSPLGIYRRLIGLYKANRLSFADVVTFNMDEYVGLSPDHPQSYHFFMWDNFFSHVDLKREHIHLLDGMAKDTGAECAAYEEAIRTAGGISLFLGGMGADGHIAFNEPGSSLSSRTRIKTLNRDTRIANSRFFDGDPEKVPATALTVGVGTIMDAREVLILACGHNKARALQAAVEGGVTQMWTLSCLQTHPHAIIVCDEEATDELKVGTVRYFKSVEGLA